PGIVFRFIENLINYVGILLIFFSNGSEKLLSMFSLNRMTMPINDHIHSTCNRSIDHLEKQMIGMIRILDKSSIRIYTNGSPNHCGIPITSKPPDGSCIIKPRPPIMPTQTDTVQSDFFPVLIDHLAFFIHRKPAISLYKINIYRIVNPIL